MEKHISRENFCFQDGSLWIRKRTLQEGWENGTELVEVGTGSEERPEDYLSVVKSKGMGLGSLRMGGLDVFFASPISSHVHPSFFEPQGMNLLKVVREGMFRAGPFHIGGPEGSHPLHGTAWCAPALDVSVSSVRGQATIRGALIFETLFGPRARIETETTFCPSSKRLEVMDHISNQSKEIAFPLLYMFHTNCNPLLPHSTLHGRFESSQARDARAQEGFKTFMKFEQAEALFEEQVYYHRVSRDNEGWATVALVNQEKNKAISVSYDEGFPLLVEWKCLRLDFQVVGLEGSTSKVEGSALEEKEGRRIVLEPGQSRSFRMRIQAYTTSQEVESLLKSLS